MDKAEIQRKIHELERKIDQYMEQKRKHKSDTDKVNDIFRKAESARRKVMGEFTAMHSETKRRSAAIVSDKFRNRYNSQMDKIFKGAKATQAFDGFNVFIRKARQALMNTDDSIKELDRKINNAKRRIEELKNELNQGDK